MILSKAVVKLYRSIENSGEVNIDPKVTVLVGQNESGKTAFLQALYKTQPVDSGIAFDVTDDYPRKSLNEYETVHETQPADVTELTYTLEPQEVDRINQELGVKLIDSLSFTKVTKYGGPATITISLPEATYLKAKVAAAGLPAEISNQAASKSSLKLLIAYLQQEDLNSEGKAFLSSLVAMFEKSTWNTYLDWYVYNNYLSSGIPKFLYFDDYYLLPGKVNLQNLNHRVVASAQPGQLPLTSEEKTVLSLLRMAGVDLQTLTDTGGYEKVKAKLEGISNSITDKIFEYWTQNKELDIEFDLRADPKDQPPFNTGTNLYIRIRNRRHRVTVPFSQRSKGFIWFFSFIVWFSSIKKQFPSDRDLILLLDEPGLSLHALAQEDFLRYIDNLAKSHQLLYTTHSPFMVHSDRLNQVRTVQDYLEGGTKVSDNVSGADAKTVFPLQAALGYSIAQNLFISKRNLLVEGVGDLVYLQFFSSLLDKAGRPSLRDDVVVVPVGGLDKIATFVALLRGNQLELVVLHDYESKPDPRLESLVREKLIRDKQVLNYSLYRDVPDGMSRMNTDIEDLISPSLYLKLFNSAYSKELAGVTILETNLLPGDRIVERIDKYLQSSSIQLRASGGFNHYLVANYLASNPVSISKIDAATLKRFEQIFVAVNKLYTTD